MQLGNGSQIVIVGGGPSGSFTALHLLNYAAQAGIKLDITILEPRNFKQSGPGGCNKCAGVLSPNLTNNLKTLELELPKEVIQSEIAFYILHLNGVKLTVRRPDSHHNIYSVYRGSGPRIVGVPAVRSFDGWLLDEAEKRGANILRRRVLNIKRDVKPIVITPREEIPTDLVVVATGVNTPAPLDDNWGYKPPTTEVMAQDEVPRPDSFADDSVSVFFDHPSGIIFGAVIPKGRYANISLLGHGMPKNAVGAFLDAHGLTDFFSTKAPGLCGCTPNVSVSKAENFFADRMAAVGDASVTRLYKDGIGAAYLTSQAVAKTAVYQGVSRRDFETGFKPVCGQIDADNQYGKWLFRLWSASRRSTWLMNAWRRAIQYEANLPPEDHVHTRVLWGMFTGSESYRQLFWLSISRRAFAGMWRGAWLNLNNH